MTPLDRRAFLHGVTATAALATLGPPLRARAEDPVEQAMARAATAFLAALDAGQQRRAVFAFTDAERSNWHYTQNDANHIHSVWHDPRNDFGADRRSAHYQMGSHHG